MLDQELINEVKKELPVEIEHIFISSVANQGIVKLKDILWQKLNK